MTMRWMVDLGDMESFDVTLSMKLKKRDFEFPIDSELEDVFGA